MVNSGPADFFTPKAPLRNALYKNNRDGTFTDVTDKAGLPDQALRHGRRRRRFRQRRLPGPARHQLRPADPLQEQRQRHVHGRHREVRSPHRPRLDDKRRVVRLRQRRQAGSVSLQLRAVLVEEQHLLRRQQAREALLLHPARLQADAERPLSQQRRRHVHAHERRHRHRTRPRQGPGRRRHRHQRRRADGFVRRERHRPELPVREPRQRQVGGDRPGGRSGVQRQRHPALGHGRRRDRLRPGRQAGSLRRQRRPGDVLALPQRRPRVLLGRRRDQRRRAGHAGC